MTTLAVILLIAVVVLMVYPGPVRVARALGGKSFDISSARNTKRQYSMKYLSGQSPVVDGWEMTETLVGIGARPLPEGYNYVFFEKMPDYDPAYSRWANLDNQLAIIGEGKVYHHYVETADNVKSAFLKAAGKVYAEFNKVYKDQQKRQQDVERQKRQEKALLNFVKTGTPESRVIIGKEQQWVDDK